MKTRIRLWVVSLLAGLLFGCDDFIAEDVSGETLVLHSPADKVNVPSSKVTFWWDALEVNTSYRLQVVVPSFEQTTLLVLDTLLNTHQVTAVLDSGRYAWRVRAENGTYRGGFSEPRSFTIAGSTNPVGADSDSREIRTLTE